MKARIIDIYPDAERPPWSLFCEDDTGEPIPYADADSYTATVRVAGSTFTIAGGFVASSVPTLDRDQDDDVPSLLFSASPGAFASLDRSGPAKVIVYIGTGDVVARHDFPAKVIL